MLYIGLDDDGKPGGVPDLDGIQLKIADRIKNNILPPTLGLFDIASDTVDNVPVIKILISSGLEKPYYIAKHSVTKTGFDFCTVKNILSGTWSGVKRKIC